MIAIPLILIAIFMETCGGKGVTNAPSPSHPPASPSTATGVPVIDDLASALETGSVAQLAGAMIYTDRPCTHAPGMGTVPCPATAPEGTSIRSFPYGGCSPQFSEDPAADAIRTQFLQSVLGQDSCRIFAIANTTTTDRLDARITYYIIAESISRPQAAVILGIGDDGLRDIFTGCGYTAADLADRYSSFLIPPRR